MRMLPLMAFALWFSSMAYAEDASSPAAVQEAEAKYARAVKDADDEFTRHMAAAKTDLITALQLEMEIQTKNGMLDAAVVIQDTITRLQHADLAPPSASDPWNSHDHADTSGREVKIPSVDWQPLGASGIQNAIMLGPFPKGTDPKDILAYLDSGDFHKPYFGVSITKSSVDGSGNLNCMDLDNSEFYWLIYVKPSGRKSAELMVTGQANPSDHTNSSELYVDGQAVTSGSKVRLAPTGSTIILRQIHNSSYFNAWIRLLSDSDLLTAP